jgi:LEA14-like dessication related protein
MLCHVLFALKPLKIPDTIKIQTLFGENTWNSKEYIYRLKLKNHNKTPMETRPSIKNHLSFKIH